MNEMMDTILLEALELLEQGLSVDDIVARYPAQAAELRPFLLTAAALSRLATQPAAAAETQSKRAFLATAARAAEQPRARGLAGLGRRLALPIMAVLAVLFLGAAGLVGASAAAMPDDTLYGAKLFVERARLGLAADPERAAALREQFRQERLREVAQLLAAGREADVSLTGPIEAMSGARWMVAGVAVTISPATVIDGAPAIGAEAQIDGRTVGGAVAAARVTILVGAAPQPTPQPTADDRPTTAEPTDDEGMDEPSPGVQPAATITTTPTATATGTATASPSPTLTPPATVSPAPTAAPPTDTPPTATPRPTAPPVPSATPDDDDDNSNDNDGDNENDNDDNANDNGGDDNANDNGGDDNANDNGGDDNANDNGGDDNANDNGDDNANDNGGDDNQNDNDSDSDSDNDDNSGSGGGDNDNDNSGGDDDQND